MMFDLPLRVLLVRYQWTQKFLRVCLVITLEVILGLHLHWLSGRFFTLSSWIVLTIVKEDSDLSISDIHGSMTSRSTKRRTLNRFGELVGFNVFKIAAQLMKAS